MYHTPKEEQSKICYVLHEKFILDPFGNVYPCCTWSHTFNINKKWLMGNVREYGGSFNKLWEQTISFRKDVSTSKCLYCTAVEKHKNQKIEKQFF